MPAANTLRAVSAETEWTAQAFPFSRVGLTAVRFEELTALHLQNNKQNPQNRSCDELPFYDWEAAKLAKIFAAHSDDIVLCALVAAMMDYIKQGELKKREEKRQASHTATQSA